MISGNWRMNKYRDSSGIRRSPYLSGVGRLATEVDYSTRYLSEPDRRGWGTVFTWNMQDFTNVSIYGLRILKWTIVIKLNVIEFLTSCFLQSVRRRSYFACPTWHLPLCFMPFEASQLSGKHRFAFLKCLSHMPDEAFLSCQKASFGLRKRLSRCGMICM